MNDPRPHDLTPRIALWSGVGSVVLHACLLALLGPFGTERAGEEEELRGPEPERTPVRLEERPPIEVIRITEAEPLTSPREERTTVRTASPASAPSRAPDVPSASSPPEPAAALPAGLDEVRVELASAPLTSPYGATVPAERIEAKPFRPNLSLQPEKDEEKGGWFSGFSVSFSSGGICNTATPGGGGPVVFGGGLR